MNYKPHGYAEVGYGIVHHVYASDVRVLDFDFNGTNLVRSLQRNGVAYTVPTGRKLVILGWSVSHDNSSNPPALSHGSVVDTEDVVLSVYRWAIYKMFDHVSIHVVATEGNYITVDCNGTQMYWSQVIGYEVDV